VDRNAPALALAAHSRWQFWDGRADRLWVQALGPIENANEFGSSRMFVVHALDDRYHADYSAVWGALPALSDTTRFPANGKPGSPEWVAMSDDDRATATRVFVNFGKSIAAYERTFRVQGSALDRYVAGDASALTDAQKDGLAAFLKAGCTQCHYGPRLTDDAFHVVRWPTGRADGHPDRGRIDGVAQIIGAEISGASVYSDAPEPIDLVPVDSELGAFKTPTLRGIAQTAPYGHGGAYATLEEVLANHQGLAADDPRAAGTAEPWLPTLDALAQQSILEFLRILRADPIVP
jgi:cytochrome c peroxidase